MITGKRFAAGFCALFAALSMGLSPTSAVADDEPDDRGSGPAPKVELLLDASGSMRARDIDGKSRMAAAKQAFNEVLDATPESVDLGIRTLGANYRGDDRKTGCKDTEQLYPVGPLDRADAKAAVATLAPTGWTPIGPALLKAADDLKGGEGSRRIVLISDGEDTCQPLDPCEVAREISAKGIDLTIDTLGLVPNTKMRAQLSCIAEATGGTYTSIRHTDELTDRVGQLVDRAADPVVRPVAVEGATSCAAAPELKPGVYTDRTGFGEHRWYRVDVEPGQELRASEVNERTMAAELKRVAVEKFSALRAREGEVRSNSQRIPEVELQVRMLEERLSKSAVVRSPQRPQISGLGALLQGGGEEIRFGHGL